MNSERSCRRKEFRMMKYKSIIKLKNIQVVFIQDVY